MKSRINSIWAEKYRPKTMEDYIFQDLEQKAKFSEMIREGTIPNLLFSGVQGTGKTSLSRILVAALGIDPMDRIVINGSDENSVDDMRGKIKSFAQTIAFSRFKVVQLEEMDYLSPNAQGALRYIIEDFSSHCRFIGTCNYDNRILDPIKSRFQHYRFKAPSFEMAIERAVEILIKEEIEFDDEILEKYIATAYPDLRSIIQLLEQNSVGGKLILQQMTTRGDYKFKMLDLIEIGNLKELRKVVCENILREEYEDVYRFLYTNLHKVPKFANDSESLDSALVTLASYLYKHSLVADPEINIAAMFIELDRI